MPRLTITIPPVVYKRLSALSMQDNDSMSNIINKLVNVGINYMTEINNNAKYGGDAVEQHCQHLIIQMNALLKNMSVEVLKLKHDDFEKLQQAAVVKYKELAQA